MTADIGTIVASTTFLIHDYVMYTVLQFRVDIHLMLLLAHCQKLIQVNEDNLRNSLLFLVVEAPSLIVLRN